MQQPKTPGVYTIEQNAFSNSVVGVDTAIPAFVGYTERATYDGKQLTEIPTRIDSFKQFQDYFGGSFLQTFDLTAIDTNNTGTPVATNSEDFAVLPSPVQISPSKASNDFNLTLSADKPRYLYNAIKLFYLNGGSTCYIVSIGRDKSDFKSDDFITGINLLRYEQDPTMLLCPDALQLKSDDYNTVVQYMLMHCEEMQSRVALFDVYKGAVTKPDDMNVRISNFREGVGQNNLNYGIAYFPWVHTSLLSDTDVSFLNLTAPALQNLKELLNSPPSTGPGPAIAQGGATVGNTPPAVAVTTAAVVAAAATAAATTAAKLTDAIATANANAVAAAAKAALINGATLDTVTNAANNAFDAGHQSKGVQDAIANTVTPTAADIPALVAAIASAAVTASPADAATLTNAKAVEAAAKSAQSDPDDAKKAVDDAVNIDAKASAAVAAQTALVGTTAVITNATASTLTNARAAKALTATSLADAQAGVNDALKALADASSKVDSTAAELLKAYNNLSGAADNPTFRDTLSAAQDAANGARDTAAIATNALATSRQHLAQANAADDAAAKIIVAALAGIAAGSMPAKPAVAGPDGKPPYMVPGLPIQAGPPVVAGPPADIFDQAIALLESTAMNNAVADPTQTAQIAKMLKDKRDAINNSLLKLFPTYKMLMTVLLRYLNTMPVAPAMAGVYTAVDTGRGVWKAPANVSLTAVVAPTVSLSDQKQENLNVDAVTGKSINAIRNFKGLGVMVWGARTLDGNSKDWRFINVRRTMIFIEQSVKLACRSYVFEPNDANTWTNVKSMISSFLFNLWKEGALAGAVPTDAYSVAVGLGSTMTADDILDGFMNVTIMVAIVRPAEFIMLTFQQQLQKS